MIRFWKPILFTTISIGGGLFGCAFILLTIKADISAVSSELSLAERDLYDSAEVLRALEMQVENSTQPEILKMRVDGRLVPANEGSIIRVKIVSGKEIPQPLALNGRHG